MTAVATPREATKAVAAPVERTLRPARTSLLVTPEELAKLERGVDYTGKLELVGRSQTYIWHREHASEMAQVQELIDTQIKGGATVFDVTGGLDNAQKVKAAGPDTEDLMSVAPIVGG